MKAKDLIKILEANPEADILIEDAENLHPVLAGVYHWEYVSTYPETPDETSGFVFTPLLLSYASKSGPPDPEPVNAFEDYAIKDAPEEFTMDMFRESVRKLREERDVLGEWVADAHAYYPNERDED